MLILDMGKLPIYYITVDDEFAENGETLGISKIAWTATPAIITKGLAFDITSKKMKFSADNLKYRIAAPLAIPDDLIYREDEEYGQYYVAFKAEQIENMHMKFMRNINNHNLYNEEHDAKRITDNSYLLDILYLDSQAKVDMVKTDYGIDVPMYTLFTITQIETPEYYQYLVDNEMTGLSLEGFLGLSLKLNNKIKQKEEKMNELTLPDGEHTINDKVYVVKDGKVIDIKDVVKTDMEDIIPSGDTQVALTESKLLDGTPVRYDGELAVGKTLEVQKEDGTWVKASEGQHDLEGYVVFVDAEGLINDVQTPDTKKVDKVGLADMVPTDVVTTDVVVDNVDYYTKAEIDAKLEEIYKMIGDMKATQIIKDDGEENVMVNKMTKTEKMSMALSRIKLKN